MNYPVIIDKDKDSAYGVTVPDLPGCFSAGDTLDEALENTKEAILLHIEGLIDDQENIPEPSKIESYRKKLKNSIVAVVSVDLSALFGKVKRINITFPEKLLHRVDHFAQSHGESRSGLLVNAALEYIDSHSNENISVQRG